MRQPCFTLSVDDGHPLDLRLAELLNRHGVQATFYLPVSNHEGPPVMQANDARQLARRFEIGSHTRSHSFLGQVDDSRAWSEITDGKRMLEDWLGQQVPGFCYPGGRYLNKHVSMVRRAGFCYARTTQNLRTDVGVRRFEMPTTLQFYPHPRSVLMRNFISQGDWRPRLPALRQAWVDSDWLQRLYRLFDHAAAERGVFHLWCHSRDIERFGLWDAFEHFLAHVAARLPPDALVSNGDLVSHRQDERPPGATAAPVPDRRPTRNEAG